MAVVDQQPGGDAGRDLNVRYQDDVYTVGRTLAVLVMDVPQENGHFAAVLPGPDGAGRHRERRRPGGAADAY